MKKFLNLVLILFSVMAFGQKNLGDWATNSVQFYEKGVLIKQTKYIPVPIYNSLQTSPTSWDKIKVQLYSINGISASTYFPVNKNERVKIGTDYNPPIVDHLSNVLSKRNYFDALNNTLYLQNGEIIAFKNTYDLYFLHKANCTIINNIKYKDIRIRYNGIDYNCLVLCTTHAPDRPLMGSFFFSSLKIPTV